ncbi:MAG TPA: PAS domain-containing protein [Gemmataceae bacterium]|jgi:hypothetical protein|nr:PAS domain-containing protein [Gemmataceae bacterium]
MSEQTIPFQAQLMKKPAEGRGPGRPASRVQWIGESDYWVAPECRGEPEFIMPLSEDSVLEVATMQTTARKLSLQAAINCTSRLALRVALAATGLNPCWHPLEWPGPAVVKAPASCASLGVRFLPTNWYIATLAKVAPDLARFGVIEERIDGPQYELDGFVVGGRIEYFSPLLQHWNEAGDKILGYQRQEPSAQDWLGAALTAVKAVGIDDAPFCLEMRYDRRCGGWKLIEIHARLGEDPGLPALMSDEDPLRAIERACARGTRYAAAS